MKLSVTLLIATLLMSSSVAARQSLRQYSASLDNSSWAVKTATPLRCELGHTIPNFGDALFVSEANKELNLLFRLQMTRLPDDYSLAKVLSVAPNWRPGEPTKAVADMKLLKQFDGNLPKKPAWIMLTELEQGFSPTFYFADWHSPYDQVVASLNPVHFGNPYQKFSQCMAGLLKYNFDDIALSMLNYQSNSNEFTRESQARLTQIAEYLKHDKAIASVEIDTFTDSYGGRWINEELSRKRAKALKEFFVANGVDEKLIRTDGFGEKRHVAANETSRGRATNRRAVVQLVRAQAPHF
jgi:outer membrane protein OmpA-like peptidoglycan-associated protein